MSQISFKDVELYDWVNYFNELVEKIVLLENKENRHDVLKTKSRECFGNESRYDFLDPLSFIYTLAQKNTSNQKNNIYPLVKNVFSLNSNIPTDWTFPSPPTNVLTRFRDDNQYNPELLWRIFLAASKGKRIDNEDFKNVLNIVGVKEAKLTQTLFLINPRLFLPIDDRTLSLPIFSEREHQNIKENIRINGFTYYKDTIDLIQSKFPNCQLYEINLLAYLWFKDELKTNNTFYQIGSNAEGGSDKSIDDKIKDFHKNSSVWVGGPTSGDKGTRIYPISEPVKGDIILSHFNHFGNGIGIVLYNEYSGNVDYNSDLSIKVLWINKEEQPNAVNSKQLLGLSKAVEVKNSFKTKYPNTFNIIEDLSTRNKMINGTLKDRIKNIILQGAPGTGKTRMAKQLALYLKKEGSSLVDFLDTNLSQNNPIFKDDPKIELDDEQIKLVQFHPGYSYEDFVRGIITDIIDGRVIYKVQDKVLMKIVKKANEDQNKHFILIIDEINRANLASVLGELIYALEYRGEKVEGIYKDTETNEAEIVIPDNLYIIGTMNTADRSIGHIDYAIRRRFIFREVRSQIDAITGKKEKELFEQIERLFGDSHLSPDFKREDVMIGHSYFLTQQDSLHQRLTYEIKPLLKEYIKDGILIGDDIITKVEELTIIDG